MAPPFGVAALCLYHCSPRVAREIRGILTCRCPYLPQPYGCGPTRVLSYPLDTGGNMWHGSRSLSHLREHLTARTGDGHAPPLSSSGKIFNLAFILLSLPVRFPALTPIKPQASRLVVLPPNSFKFQSCDRTSQAACLTASLRHWGGSWPTQHLACIVYGWDYPGI